MQNLHVIYGLTNIFCGILFILISIPLMTKKVPMNKLYGFRIPKSFMSDENWYKINHYGGKQFIQWSVLLIFIGILYFIFPIKELPNEIHHAFLAVAPIFICVAVVIAKTILFSRRL